MPTVTGAWAPNGSTNQRMRLVVDYTVPTPAAGQSSVTVTGTVLVEAGYSFYHNGATLSWSGSLLGSGSASKNLNVATNGSQTIHSFSTTVALGASATSKSVAFSLSGVSYVGATASVSASIPIPALAVTPAPTNVAVSWPENGVNRLTWAGAPVDGIMYRQRLVAGAGSLHAQMGEWRWWTQASQAAPYDMAIPDGYERQFALKRGSSAWSYSPILRTFYAPNTPSAPTVTRSSDSRHTVRWTVTVTAARPVARFFVQRSRLSVGTWQTVATVSGAARSWVDSTSMPNDRIAYRIVADNAAGQQVGAESSHIRTSPAAPTGVLAERSGPAAALLTWVNRARDATSILIQEQTSANLGTTWSEWSTRATDSNITPVATSRAIAGLDASLWYRFRVVAVGANTAPNSTVYGYSSATGIIRPAAKPAAPSSLAPSGVVSATEPALFRWRHNPTDGSDQTAFELQYRPVGSVEWLTVTGASTNVQQAAVDITDSGLVEWRVRTRGQHADWSDWSAVGVFEVLDPPSVTIISPTEAEAIHSNRATLTIGYADATEAAMVGWRAELLDADGELLETLVGREATEVIRFRTELDNLSGYTARVWVTSGTSLESAPAEVTFTTDFLPPATPDLTAEWLDDEGLVRLGVEDHPGDGVATVDTVTNRIERSTDLGQTWVVLADDLPLDVGWDDTLVPLGVIVWHRVVAVAELGTEAASDPIETLTSTDRVWLTGRDGTALSLLADMAISPTHGHERASEVYYGRSRPTVHYGEGRPITVGVTGTLVDGYGLGDDWTVMLGQDVYYRDPTGRAFWASITDSISLPQESHVKRGISFSVEQIHVEE